MKQAGQLSTASVVPLAPLDEVSISRIARKTDEAATTLLRDLKRRDYLDGAYATAMFNLKLVDAGLDPDPQRIPVLLSMLLLEDVQNTDVDTEGASALMDLRTKEWSDEAQAMLLRAQLLGLYLPETVSLRFEMFARKQRAIAAKREQLLSEKPRRAPGNAGLRNKGYR